MDAALYVKILEKDLLETLDYYEYDIDDIIFQHDNDLKHRVHITKNWLEANNILILDWPAQSPDLNPIEHMWNELERKLRQFKELINNKDQL